MYSIIYINILYIHANICPYVYNLPFVGAESSETSFLIKSYSTSRSKQG